MSATYELRGGVAVITLDNPPVNGLAWATRKAIAAGIEQAELDPAVRAIVITGAGKAFSGGADIREFGTPQSSAEPNLHSVLRVIEECSKPVVAAVHAVAMGEADDAEFRDHHRPAKDRADEEQNHDCFPRQR